MNKIKFLGFIGLFIILFISTASSAIKNDDKYTVQSEQANVEIAQGNQLLFRGYYDSEKYLMISNMDQAIKHYTKALAIEYKAYPLVLIGMACQRLEKYSDAINFYSKAITLDPDADSGMYFLRSVCYMKLGLNGDKDLKKAAAIAPDKVYTFNAFEAPLGYQGWNGKTYDEIAYPEKHTYFMKPVVDVAGPIVLGGIIFTALSKK